MTNCFILASRWEGVEALDDGWARAPARPAPSTASAKGAGRKRRSSARNSRLLMSETMDTATAGFRVGYEAGKKCPEFCGSFVVEYN